MDKMIPADQVFSEMYQELTEIYRHCQSSINEIIARLPEIAYEQYGVGGENIHRGYYCPSPVFDIYVGNAGRGRLVKKKTKRTKPEFIFGFDCNNNLIRVVRPFSTEYILRKDGMEIGIEVENNTEITGLSICKYQGEILSSYAICLCAPYESRVVDIDEERYLLEDNTLNVEWYRLCAIKKPWILGRNRLIFRIENNRFISYTYQELNIDGTEKADRNAEYRVAANKKVRWDLIHRVI